MGGDVGRSQEEQSEENCNQYSVCEKNTSMFNKRKEKATPCSSLGGLKLLSWNWGWSSKSVVSGLLLSSSHLQSVPRNLCLRVTSCPLPKCYKSAETAYCFIEGTWLRTSFLISQRGLLESWEAPGILLPLDLF